MDKQKEFFRNLLTHSPVSGRTMAVFGGLLPLVILFFYVVLRSGPLAPVPVTVTNVESLSVSPALFGIGTIEARSIHKIGPNVPSRVKRVLVQVGDTVQSGQLVVEMERADLELLNSEAEREFVRKSMALEQASTMKQTDAQAFILPNANLRLRTPISGLVISRNIEPGTSVVAAQSIIEVIDPKTLWINVRFDQVSSSGLSAGLQAQIVLRSLNTTLFGRILRVEPIADAVTEETLAKVVFDVVPTPLPPLGEIAEVTVALPALNPGPSVPNASLQRLDGQLGVWLVKNGKIHFTPVKIGATDLGGRVQILEGLKISDQVVVYSQSALGLRSRIKIVERLTANQK